MGMPSVNVSFTEKAIASIKRGDRGIVALILKDGAELTKRQITVTDATDIPTTLSATNKKQIELALVGYQNAPRKIVCYVLAADAENYNDALNYLATEKFDYLAIPTIATDGMEATVGTWIKNQNQNGKKCKVVLPSYAGDDPHIINVGTTTFVSGDTTYTGEQYCARIAGLIAGTPLSISCTYAPLNELTDCERLTKGEMDTAVDAGKFIVFFDCEKVKVGRGVNSFVTTTAEKGDQFKKIKIVECMDMMYDDIVKTAQDNYLGKYPNSYDNKCLLMSAIGAYFDQLKMDNIVSTYTIGIDIEAQKAYLKSKGVEVENMSDDEIKVADTGTKVFMAAKVKILDAIEDIELPITI